MGRPIPNETAGPTVEKEIGGTRFIVTAQFARTGETAVEIMRRIILWEAEKMNQNRE